MENLSVRCAEHAVIIENTLVAIASAEIGRVRDSASGIGNVSTVFSGEVKRLANSSTDNSAKMAKDISSLERKIEASAQTSLDATGSVKEIMGEVASILDDVNALSRSMTAIREKSEETPGSFAT